MISNNKRLLLPKHVGIRCFEIQLTVISALFGVITGCITTTGKEDLITCPEPRPEVCTMHFDPVCGLQREARQDKWKSYSNACVACTYPSVVGYRKGPCDKLE